MLFNTNQRASQRLTRPEVCFCNQPCLSTSATNDTVLRLVERWRNGASTGDAGVSTPSAARAAASEAAAASALTVCGTGDVGIGNTDDVVVSLRFVGSLPRRVAAYESDTTSSYNCSRKSLLKFYRNEKEKIEISISIFIFFQNLFFLQK